MRNRSVTSRSVGLAATAAVAGLLGAFGMSSADASFSIDVRLDGSTYGSGKSTTVSAGSTLNLAIYAEVSAADANLTGFQEAFMGFQLTPSGSSTGSMLNLAVVGTPAVADANGNVTSPSTGFAGFGATNQASTDPNVHYAFQSDTTGNVVSIGGTDASSPSGWFYARSTSMQPATAGTQVSSTQQEWKIGTLTLQVAPGAAGDTLSLSVVQRTAPAGSNVPAAVWQEVASAGITDLDSGIITAASPFVVNIQAAQTRHIGDTNNDGTIDVFDLNNVLNNFGWNGTAGGNIGDDNSDGVVDVFDMNDVLNNFGWAAAEPALSAVPEPASLSMLGLGGLALLRRRRRA